jgi:hypothetical protein
MKLSFRALFFSSLLIISCSGNTNDSAEYKPKFERVEGFWSNCEDESSESYFSKLTDPKSQREDWYKISSYIAEFWCTLSNAGFIYVGAKHKSYELLFAGIASILSHSIPKQWLLHLDKAGVAIVFLKLLKEFNVLTENPETALILLTSLGVIGATDIYLARNYAKTWPHVVWHLSAALISDIFLGLME